MPARCPARRGILRTCSTPSAANSRIGCCRGVFCDVCDPPTAGSWNAESAHTGERSRLAIGETDDGQILAILRLRRGTPVLAGPIEVRLRGIREHDGELAVGRELTWRRRRRLRIVLRIASRARAKAAWHIIRPAQVPTRNAVFRRALGGANDQLTIADKGNERIHRKLSIVGNRCPLNGFPFVPVRLREDLFLRLRGKRSENG